MEADDVVVFGGYTLGWITRGACESASAAKPSFCTAVRAHLASCILHLTWRASVRAWLRRLSRV